MEEIQARDEQIKKLLVEKDRLERRIERAVEYLDLQQQDPQVPPIEKVKNDVVLSYLQD